MLYSTRCARDRPGSPRACRTPPPAWPQLRCVDVGAVAGLLDPRPGRVVGQAAALFMVEGVAQRAERLLPAGRRDVEALARLQVDWAICFRLLPMRAFCRVRSRSTWAAAVVQVYVRRHGPLQQHGRPDADRRPWLARRMFRRRHAGADDCSAAVGRRRPATGGSATRHHGQADACAASHATRHRSRAVFGEHQARGNARRIHDGRRNVLLGASRRQVTRSYSASGPDLLRFFVAPACSRAACPACSPKLRPRCYTRGTCKSSALRRRLRDYGWSSRRNHGHPAGYTSLRAEVTTSEPRRFCDHHDFLGTAASGA